MGSRYEFWYFNLVYLKMQDQNFQYNFSRALANNDYSIRIHADLIGESNNKDDVVKFNMKHFPAGKRSTDYVITWDSYLNAWL